MWRAKSDSLARVGVDMLRLTAAEQAIHRTRKLGLMCDKGYLPPHPHPPLTPHSHYLYTRPQWTIPLPMIGVICAEEEVIAS